MKRFNLIHDDNMIASLSMIYNCIMYIVIALPNILQYCLM